MAVDTAWVGVIGALGGVVVAALAEGVRAWLAFRREKRWSLHDERRAHLEAVYESLEQFREVCGRWLANTMRTLATGTHETLELPAKAIPWSRMQMLVHFYVPELKPYLADIEQAGPHLGTAMAEVSLTRARSPAQFEAAMLPIEGAYKELDRTVNAMRDKLVALSNEVRLRKQKDAGR